MPLQTKQKTEQKTKTNQSHFLECRKQNRFNFLIGTFKLVIYSH